MTQAALRNLRKAERSQPSYSGVSGKSTVRLVPMLKTLRMQSAHLAIRNLRFTLMFSTREHRVRFTRLMSQSTITMRLSESDSNSLTHSAPCKRNLYAQ